MAVFYMKIEDHYRRLSLLEAEGAKPLMDCIDEGTVTDMRALCSRLAEQLHADSSG